jgi:alpha-D-ribose 1-methylphosphonate 5-triphosphate diphosphatase PhnM
VVGWQEADGRAAADFELVAVGITLCIGALCVGEVSGVNVEAAALPQPATSMAASVRALTFREIITGS